MTQHYYSDRQVKTEDLVDGAVTTPKISNGAVTPAKLSFGTWEKIADITLTSAAAEIEVTGLDLNSDELYWIIAIVKFTSSPGGQDFFEVNNDTTATNYYVEEMRAGGTNIAANNYNDPRIDEGVSGCTYAIYDILLAKGNIARIHTRLIPIDHCIEYSWRWTGTANITSVQIRNTSGNYLDAGTRIIVFKPSD